LAQSAHFQASLQIGADCGEHNPDGETVQFNCRLSR
jgi:hypothetical protein